MLQEEQQQKEAAFPIRINVFFKKPNNIKEEIRRLVEVAYFTLGPEISLQKMGFLHPRFADC